MQLLAQVNYVSTAMCHNVGMHYLHNGAPEIVIHGDLKSSNGTHCGSACVSIN